MDKKEIERIRKWNRQEEQLMKLPKEERLKKLYGRYLNWAFDFGITIGHAKNKKEEMALQGIFRKQFKSSLTRALKKAEVLPL
jgi:23S rRNA C2498 (ribose-2'-O)-methylase RlmM